MHAFARFRFVALGLVALSALLAFAGPAAAASDKVVRDDYSGLDAGVDVCGLIVDVSFAGTFRGTIHNWVIGPADPPADNFWIGNFQDHGSATYTNVATGESVSGTWRTNVKEASLIHVEGSLWEYSYAVNGIPVRLGNNLLKDRGHIVITDTIDFGDLADDSDDAFVSGVASLIAGPHPAYNSDAFCTALVAAIG
jgi:hypothetical protein